MPIELFNLYWLLLGATLLGSIALVFAANTVPGAERKMAVLVPLSLVLLVVAGRWPSVLIPGPLNPDESLMLAQALKYKLDWIPWRSVDPGTGGPINSLALLFLHAFGMPIGYPLARMTAILCIAVHLVLMFRTMVRIGGFGSAATACLPGAAFFALATHPDFTHYSSELASLAVISLMTWLISKLPSRRDDRGLSFAIGVSAFLVCMSKVQGVPLAALLALGLLMLVTDDLRSFGRRVGFIALGGIAGVAALVALLAWAGALDDFNISFLQLPFQYVTSPLDWNGLVSLVALTGETNAYMWASIWFVGAALVLFPLHAAIVHDPRQAVLRVLAALLVFGGAYLALTRPGRLFAHYMAYLTLALPWICALLLPWPRPSAPEPAPAEERPA